MIKRLRVTFVCITMVLVMSLMSVMLVLLYNSTAEQLESSSIHTLQEALDVPMMPGRPGTGVRSCFVLQESPNGEILISEQGYYDLSDAAMVEDICRQASAQESSIGVLEDYALRFYRQEYPYGNRYAFTDITEEIESLDNLLEICLMVGVGSFVGFLIISILLAYWASRPVEKAFDQQKQFVSDASHELKTPLTIILTNAEMLRSEEYGSEQKNQITDTLLDVSQQMRGLVENLLQLARGDQGRQKKEVLRVDMTALTENAIMAFEPIYFERDLMLESDLEPGLFVKGDPGQLQQVLNILLDNGQKYASSNGPAEMSLVRQGKRVQLAFFTPGTPLTAQQCEDIFKRFYRTDKARTLSGSYGLGLSIADNIMKSHNGRIWAQGVEDGNVFYVSLPLA